MTVLAALSGALAQADRAIAGRRGGILGPFGSGSSLPPFMVPTGHAPPVRLSGENRLITYADSVATYPTIYAVWSKLVRNLATTPLGVFVDEGDGTYIRKYGTDLEDLLRSPAPGKGLIDLLQWLFNPYFVEGNGLIAKYRKDGDGTPPTNLIPLDWRYMSALAYPGGPVEQWISYQIGIAKALDPSEVVHLAWHSPNGSVIGTSPLHSLGVSIKLDDAAGRYQGASLDNASRPAGALVIPADGKTTPEDRAEMRGQVENMHKGVDNAFRMAVLFGGVKFEKLSFSAAEAELDMTRQRSQEEVLIAYDIRRSVVAEATHRVDMQEVLRDFHRSLIPHAGIAAEVIQRQLIDPEPAWAEKHYCVRFDLRELLRGTFREEAEVASHLYVNGVTSLDESRALIELNALETDASKVPLIPHAQLQPGKDGRALPPSSLTDNQPTTDPVGPAGS